MQYIAVLRVDSILPLPLHYQSNHDCKWVVCCADIYTLKIAANHKENINSEKYTLLVSLSTPQSFFFMNQDLQSI